MAHEPDSADLSLKGRMTADIPKDRLPFCLSEVDRLDARIEIAAYARDENVFARPQGDVARGSMRRGQRKLGLEEREPSICVEVAMNAKGIDPHFANRRDFGVLDLDAPRLRVRIA